MSFVDAMQKLGKKMAVPKGLRLSDQAAKRRWESIHAGLESLINRSPLRSPEGCLNHLERMCYIELLAASCDGARRMELSTYERRKLNKYGQEVGHTPRSTGQTSQESYKCFTACMERILETDEWVRKYVKR